MPDPAETATQLPPSGHPRTLYVVDISGYVFRAYHALPPLSSPSGEPSHAVLGVTNMLQKLRQEHAPAMLAVAMDSRTKSFRHELYAEYKANRPPTPPDLKQQMGRVRELVEALAIPVFQQDGVEADDLIASLVHSARRAEFDVVIVSADKDLLQLVDDRTWMLDTGRNRVYGPAETVKKLGVPPAQVRDYLALVGDSSDNVPGVPSVGPKTATTLLKEHGDLDGVYAALEQVKRPALRAKLEDNRDQAYLSQALVTLRCDLPLVLDVEALSQGGEDRAKLADLYRELGFTRLLEGLGEASAAEPAPGPPAPPKPPAAPARIVRDGRALQELAAELTGSTRTALVSVVDGHKAEVDTVVGLCLCPSNGPASYIPLGHAYLGVGEQLAAPALDRALGPWLRDPKQPKFCADAKRDDMVLQRLGLALDGVRFDVGLASYLIDPERHAHSLKDVARFSLEHTLDAHDLLMPAKRGKGETPAGVPIEDAAEAAAELARTCLLCADALAPRLTELKAEALLTDIELPLSRVLARMQLTGIRVDADYLRGLSVQVSDQLVTLEARCRELAGHDFNVNSPRQLETILFDELELPVIKRTKTARSTDHSVLEELAVQHDLPAAILEFRSLAKLQNTYLEALPREIQPTTGRIHTDFRQTVAATGRLSSSDPNLQNIPIRTEVGRRIRRAFLPQQDWRLMAADYSQIELRVLAHLSRDPQLLEAFQKDEDVHVRTAKAIFGVPEDEVTREMRGEAKTVNFAVIYGQTQFALARNLRIQRSQAADYIRAFFLQYAGVQRYMDEVVEEGRSTGVVRTLCGRMRPLPDLNSPNRVKRQAAERVARNTPIQGSAADIIKLAMIAVDRELSAQKLQARMLLTVHDELVFEAPPAEQTTLEALVRRCMGEVLALDVPLTVDVGWGDSWDEAH